MRSSIERIRRGKVTDYHPVDPDEAVTSGSFHVDDREDFQLLVVPEQKEKTTVRITLPDEQQPAVVATDLTGEELLFQNQEAVDLFAELAGEEVEGLPEMKADEPVAPGVFEFELPDETYAVIAVGTGLDEGADMTFETSIPVAVFDDVDQRRPAQIGDRVVGEVEGFEESDSFVLHLEEGDVVEIYVGSPHGDPSVEVRAPGQEPADAFYIDDSDLGINGLDAKDQYEAETTGDHVVTVYSNDGFPMGYLFEIRTPTDE